MSWEGPPGFQMCCWGVIIQRHKLYFFPAISDSGSCLELHQQPPVSWKCNRHIPIYRLPGRLHARPPIYSGGFLHIRCSHFEKIRVSKKMIDQLDILTSVKSTSINFLCDTAACAIGFPSEKKRYNFFSLVSIRRFRLYGARSGSCGSDSDLDDCSVGLGVEISVRIRVSRSRAPVWMWFPDIRMLTLVLTTVIRKFEYVYDVRVTGSGYIAWSLFSVESDY